VSADLVLAIDQGTTSTRAALVAADGTRVAGSSRPHRQHLPAPGRVEHDPTEILDAVVRCAREALADAPLERVAGLGITNQRETIVLWSRRTGEPLGNALVWQDARTTASCAGLTESHGTLVHELTGLPLSPYFSATKLAWLLDEIPGARERAARGELAAGTIDAWLTWSLTGGVDGGAHVTDVTNASRTMLLNTETLQWDERLLAAFDVPHGLLPTVVRSWRPGGLALTRADGPLGLALPVLALLGDQQAALVGQACFAPGDAKCTFGTGAFLLANVGDERPAGAHGLLAGIAYQGSVGAPVRCLEGAMAAAGSAVSWLSDSLGLLPDAAASAAEAATVDTSGGVRVVPAFQGLYAPWWDPGARGAILGLTLHSTRAHVVRATLESLAYATRAVVEAAEAEAAIRISQLRVDGGATRNAVLVQSLADVLGRPVVRAVDEEATVRGAAFAAGLAAGVWGSLADVAALVGLHDPVEPVWSADRREQEYASWLRAVEQARAFG
jgi:glycerol kinase